MEATEPLENGPPADQLLPPSRTVPELREAAASCRACDLWRLGSRTVFGEGAAPADVMLVGEQPGEREDAEGRPFVGPAGAILDRGLADAGIDRGAAYVTNVVKHFRFERRGKRRLHQKPDPVHVAACRPWLEAELEAVGPRLLGLLGATAAPGLLGSSFPLLQGPRQFFPTPLRRATVLATV